jgi:hypothetical protein
MSFVSQCRLTLVIVVGLAAPGCSCTPTDPVHQAAHRTSNDATSNDKRSASQTKQGQSTSAETDGSKQASQGAGSSGPRGDSATVTTRDSATTSASPSTSGNSSTTTSGRSSSITNSRSAGPPLAGPKLTPREAAQIGQAALESASKEERVGKTKQAFEKALRGYQVARTYRDDPACQQAAQDLLIMLERLGEAQPSGNAGVATMPYVID